ncbi:MAG: agmatinase [Candidatus Altiarchaeales archaeon ex4484_2]|nr:MAG: agmatinase [Candidatus Altiarchaeales archaeon ex4484_2]
MHEFDSLSISWEFVEYKKAGVVFLLAPYEATVSWGKGTSKGPKAVMDAFLNLELFDEELVSSPFEVGISLLELELEGMKPLEAVRMVRDKTAGVLGDGKFPVLVGGEHSLSVGMVEAFIERYSDLSILQLDAHADLRDEFRGEKYSHACVMSRVREMADAVQVGVRSLSREENELIKKRGYTLLWARDIFDNKKWFREAIDALEDNVYLTIDLDVFDPSIMPSVGTPEPGGLDWYLLLDFLKLLCRERNVVGFDVVEFSPIKDFSSPDYLAARLLYKLVGYVFADDLG